MRYDIIGSNMQHLDVSLNEGERVFADSGTLVSKTENVIMTPRLAGGIISAMERKATGATALLTEFAAKDGSGKVSVAGVFPGKIFPGNTPATETFPLPSLAANSVSSAVAPVAFPLMALIIPPANLGVIMTFSVLLTSVPESANTRSPSLSETSGAACSTLLYRISSSATNQSVELLPINVEPVL